MGNGMTASLWSNRSMEDIAKEFKAHALHPTQPLWLQIFLYKDRGYLKELVQRAEKSGFTGLVLTVDGLYFLSTHICVSVPLFLSVSFLITCFFFFFPLAPLGCVSCLNAQPKLFESLRLPNFSMFPHLNASEVLKEVGSSFVAPEVCWKDLEWLASLSSLPVLLKGVLNPEDVVLAVKHGAKGIIVSNHGGRQMDRVISTRDALRLISDEIRRKRIEIELLVDGGLRDAHDITVALELGAKAVMLGRPILNALGSSTDEDALYMYLQGLSSNLKRNLALMGRRQLPQEETAEVRDQQEQRIFFT